MFVRTMATIPIVLQWAIDETERRRQKQLAYNEQYNINPQSIIKPIRTGIEVAAVAEETEGYDVEEMKKLTKTYAADDQGTVQGNE